MLYQLPTREFGGSVVHKAEDGIYHLIRGNSYTIDKRTFFVFGGAQSHDKEYRIEGKNWWKEEMPCEQEYHNAEKILRQNDFKFDFVITHSAPTSVQYGIAPMYEANPLTEFLEKLKNVLVYKKWFFGHYHKDIEIDERFTAVFDRFYQI